MTYGFVSVELGKFNDKRHLTLIKVGPVGTDRDAAVQSVFAEFEKTIVRVPDSDNKAAKTVHPQVRSILKEQITGIESFLSGSYSRKVQVVRLHDVDIIAVLPDPAGKYRSSADAALEDLRAAAKKCELVRRTEKRVRSVRLWLHDYDFLVDVVGALEPGDGRDGLLLPRRIPEEGHNDWTLGNPRGQREAAVKKNDSAGGVYIPSVRLVKFWAEKVWGGGEKPLKSYHAESILHWAMTRQMSFEDAMICFFDAAYASLAPGVLTADPGAPFTYVDERLEDSERKEAREGVGRARELARAASCRLDVDEALEGWMEVFGPAFPAPSSDLTRLGASLASGTAGVLATGIRADSGRPVINSRSWRPR